jgi:hypothetical protein
MQKSSVSSDMEIDADGNISEPLTLGNAGTEIPNRIGAAVASVLPHTDKDLMELKIMQLKNQVDQKAIPAAEWAKANVPGMSRLNETLTYRERSEPRQPVQMQREFSNPEDEAAYLDRVRQAMRNAK